MLLCLDLCICFFHLRHHHHPFAGEKGVSLSKNLPHVSLSFDSQRFLAKSAHSSPDCFLMDQLQTTGMKEEWERGERDASWSWIRQKDNKEKTWRGRWNTYQILFSLYFCDEKILFWKRKRENKDSRETKKSVKNHESLTRLISSCLSCCHSLLYKCHKTQDKFDF